MNSNKKNLLLSLRFMPFVIANGMNLFPILVFTQLFLTHRNLTQYVLPLVLYYCFKTTILFLIRIKPIKMTKLLYISIFIGIVGSFIGVFYKEHFLLGLIAGALLGICSGLLFPSFLTVQLHEKKINNFGNSKYGQLYALVFAIIYSLILFLLVKFSISYAFAFIGFNLLLFLLILSVYPEYKFEDDSDYPEYSVIESLFLFATGFFTIFVIKADKKLGVTDFLPYFFIFLISVVFIYLIYLIKMKPERRLSPLLTKIIIFKGMLTNFILVFTPFNQLIRKGGNVLYIVYGLYLLAVIASPIISNLLSKKYSEVNQVKIIKNGLIVGLLLLLPNGSLSYYVGIFCLSLFSAQMNQKLNRLVYENANLPKDHRLIAKFRLNNLGSIIHQISMMFIIYIITVMSNTVAIDEIFMSYSYKEIDKQAFFTLDLAKICLIGGFVVFMSLLNYQYKKKHFK